MDYDTSRIEVISQNEVDLSEADEGETIANQEDGNSQVKIGVSSRMV